MLLVITSPRHLSVLTRECVCEDSVVKSGVHQSISYMVEKIKLIPENERCWR